MKVLYLTHKPIYPIKDGGCKAMAQFLKCLLHEGFCVKHITIETDKHPFNLVDYPLEITENHAVSACYVDTKIKWTSAFIHLFNTKSYNVSRFDSPAFHQIIKTTIEEQKWDFIILESIFLAPYIQTIKDNTPTQIGIRTHNVEHLIWKKLSSNSKNLFKKWYFHKLHLDLKKVEIHSLSQVAFVAAITDIDAIHFRRLGVATRIVTIPVAMDPVPEIEDYKTNALFFIGSMNWKPNEEAVNYLMAKILPNLREKSPGICLHLAGSFMENKFPSDPENGLINHGFVEDLNAFMREHGVLVAPIFSGSGVRIKLLEAMAMGVPIISTREGLEGIKFKGSARCVKTEYEFYSNILELTQNTEKQKRLGRHARKYVLDNYSIHNISKIIRANIEN